MNFIVPTIREGSGFRWDTNFFVKVHLERAICHSPMKIQCVHILI
jgi:hypothetical protein